MDRFPAVARIARPIIRRLRSGTAEGGQEEVEMGGMGPQAKGQAADFEVGEQEPIKLTAAELQIDAGRPILDTLPGKVTDLYQLQIKHFASVADILQKKPQLKADLSHPLGRGTYGIVYRGTLRNDRTGAERSVAIKSVSIRTPFQKGVPVTTIADEVIHWSQVRAYPFVTKLLDYMRVGDVFWFVVEFAIGDMRVDIGRQPGNRYSLLTARSYFKQVASAINYMHARCVAHRDLKMENILLFHHGPGAVVAKVSDFGLCAFAWTKKDGVILRNNRCGTLMYMPPEILYQKYADPIPRKYLVDPTPHKDETQLTAGPEVKGIAKHVQRIRKVVFNHSSSVDSFSVPYRDYLLYDATNPMNNDTYALGVLLFVMVTGKYPFHRQRFANSRGLMDPIRARIIKFRFMPQSCRDFIRAMLEPHPQKRIQMRGILNHDWMKDNPFNRRDRRLAPEPVASGAVGGISTLSGSLGSPTPQPVRKTVVVTTVKKASPPSSQVAQVHPHQSAGSSQSRPVGQQQPSSGVSHPSSTSQPLSQAQPSSQPQPLSVTSTSTSTTTSTDS